jgi:hypothetical protein
MTVAHTGWISTRAAVLAAALTLTLPAEAAARRSVDEHRAADPQGQVEIITVSGRVDVVGWDKPEIAIAGTLGADVDKLDISAAGPRTTVRAVFKQASGMHFHLGSGDSGAILVVHVPQKSSLTASLVSADLTVKDLQGNQEIQTVSGDVTTATAREARVRTVSGDVQLTAGPESRLLEVGTVSGDLRVTGGSGEVTANTVSGDGSLSLGTVSRAHLKTVSGDYTVTLALAPDGRLEAQSVSGDVTLEFAGALPPAEFDLQSFSGDLSTCFGKKPASDGYGPGSRLSFREGAGTARVRVDTKSGDVRLCTKR